MITKRQTRPTAAQSAPTRAAPTQAAPAQDASTQDLPAQDLPTQAAPPLIAVRHPGHWPLAFGPYATGGVIHRVDRIAAERLLARGFELVGTDDGAAGSSAIPHAIPNSPTHEV